MSTNTLIETKKLCKFYSDGNVVALSEINLKITQGEFLILKGPSGSGKSTLLNMLGGLDTPSSGEIFFKDKPLTRLFRNSRFRINNLGFVFQAFHLWPTLNVLENVMLPLMESKMHKIDRYIKAKSMLDIVGLKDKANSAVNHISMGERQRVAIARAIVMTPAMIIADEPTGNLDSKNTENILNLFKKINKERQTTIVMATHEQVAMSFADRIIQILDGKLQ